MILITDIVRIYRKYLKLRLNIINDYVALVAFRVRFSISPLAFDLIQECYGD